MFRIYNDTTIYVMCPARFASGGPESLHQLVHRLRKIGHNAKMVYVPKLRRPTPDSYIAYNIEIEEAIQDSERNILIVPEVFTDRLDEYNKIQKAIWWLSVDFHFTSGHRFNFNDYENATTSHFVHGKYAEEFISKNTALYMYQLNPPVNDIFLKRTKQVKRENIILYNPKKGIEFTNIIMNKLPDLRWVPINNMTREHVVRLMRRSKLYVDFGFFPGPERLPREALLSGCCVIVGTRGAARFYQDVPIPAKYRVALDPFDVKEVANRIKDCLDNFDSHTLYFEQARRILSGKAQGFNTELLGIFGSRVSVKSISRFVMFYFHIGLYVRYIYDVIKRSAVKSLPKPAINALVKVKAQLTLQHQA